MPTSLVPPACLIVLMLWPVITHLRAENDDLSLTYEALSTTVVPAICAHPKQYQHYLRHSIRDMVIYLDFADLWKNVAYGIVELKDKRVLEELCLNEVYAFGQRIYLEFDWAWRSVLVWRLTWAYTTLCFEQFSRKEGTCDGKAIVVPNLESCLVDDTLDLDFIPLPYIGQALHAAKGQLSHNETVDIEFTCLSPSTTFMDNGYLLCSAILLSSCHNVSTSKRTALPFFVTLSTVVNRLSHSSVIIQSVKNVSEAHAEALETHEHDMVFDKWMRSGFVIRHGIDAWRETGLRLKLEAALLRTKILVRWKVTLCSAK